MIKYIKKKVYKFSLSNGVIYQTDIFPDEIISGRYWSLLPNGELHLAAGYSWDGISGPMPTFKCLISSSLLHDALYQIIREGHILRSNRIKADKMFRDISIEKGCPKILAWLMYFLVRNFGFKAVGSFTKTAP